MTYIHAQEKILFLYLNIFTRIVGPSWSLTVCEGFSRTVVFALMVTLEALFRFLVYPDSNIIFSAKL